MGSSRTDWCKNYRGMSGKVACEVGVRFDSLANYGTRGFMDSCPCFGNVGGCNKAEYMTDEEQQAYRRRIDQGFANIGAARKAIVEHLGGPWKRGTPGASGTIDCPVCQSKASLRFSRAGVNGHIHAACATEGCVSWME